MKKKEFVKIAEQLNKRLQVVPLLYGSLGLEQRLNVNLGADDIDVLIPEVFLDEKWTDVVQLMNENGYNLYDQHEHAFKKTGLSIAFAPIESLTPFAGIDITKIPIIEEENALYFLLDLQDYLRVYVASSKDGYRKNIKNKQDGQKIKLINEALLKSNRGDI